MSLEEIRQGRLKKLKLLREAGIDPYPAEVRRDFSLAEAAKNFNKLKSKKQIFLVGRIMSLRTQGAIVFLGMNDGTGSFQAMLKKGEMSAADFELFSQTIDIGDFVEFAGNLFLTKRKEKTLLAKNWRMVGKSLRPLPEKWHGLQDIEERFRRRYLDSLMNEEVKERFVVRGRIISLLREILDKKGFLEVETPALQPLPGGASALPFVTHHNALDMDLYLRISDELYLKRMLCGGFPKVYEICKDFRNEGIDWSHNPEFTMLEFYESFSTAEKQRDFVELIFRTLVKKIKKSTALVWNEETIDFGKKFAVISYLDLIKKHTLINDILNISKDELRLKAEQLNIKVAPGDSFQTIIDNIYKKACRPKLIQPTFVIDYPADQLPLAKRKANDANIVDAFQLIIGGIELVKAFSELNDPLDQRERFVAQEKVRLEGEGEAQRLDEEFLEALEYGMPPAGGVGIGIDRLAMLFTNTQNIREVIFFPTLRPK
jgi:lysyl-tRNA synthetase class 2